MPKKVNKISRSLLSWYDREARDLPWRKFGKDKQDPYKVWISEIMLQQTTVSVVIPYFNAFIKKWPTNKELSQASLSEIQRAWSGLGYYSRARNLFECSIIINSRFNNNFPESEKELLKLPGIGAYTAAAISAIAFNNRSVVIDGNIKRVISRLFLLKKPIKSNYNEIWRFTNLVTPDIRVGDFVQALMDLGSQICKPSKPLCESCPLILECDARKNNVELLIPKRIKKKIKAIRHGSAFIIKNNHKVLIYKRKNKGLLAGLDAFPSFGWDNEDDERINFVKKFKKKKISIVKHEFTHFTLYIQTYTVNAELPENLNILFPRDFKWVSTSKISNLSFSSLMKKIYESTLNK